MEGHTTREISFEKFGWTLISFLHLFRELYILCELNRELNFLL